MLGTRGMKLEEDVEGLDLERQRSLGRVGLVGLVGLLASAIVGGLVRSFAATGRTHLRVVVAWVIESPMVRVDR